MDNIFLGLGSNLGDRGANLQAALVDLERWGVRIIRTSSIYETEPLVMEPPGKKDQPNYYNLAVQASTDHSPEDLLMSLHAIERSLGRVRAEKWGPRTIDLDILFYGNSVCAQADLTIPHAHLADRKFVLVPLAEIAPHFVHPVLGKTVEQLLNGCKDEGTVTLLS